MLLALVSGSALAIAPMAIATVVTPAASNADEGERGLNCPDGTVVDEENAKCVDLMAGISKQLQALPAPPSLSGFGGSGGGLPGVGGIPSLGTINAPDLVLPSIGVGLVPDIPIILQPQIGGVPTAAGVAAGTGALGALPKPQMPPMPDITKMPAPQLPKINPLNPLGLPPPPDLTPGIPFI
jgi:hypothetical protein